MKRPPVPPYEVMLDVSRCPVAQRWIVTEYGSYREYIEGVRDE